MKRAVLGLAFALASLVVSARGQSFTPANGYTAEALFSVSGGSFNLGLNSLGAGNGSLYYLETNNFGEGVETHLRSYSVSSGSISNLYDYNAAVSGAFVKNQGSTVYFSATSDSTNYSVLSYSLGTATTSSVAAAIAGLYDLAFSGSAAYVSANPNGFSSNPNNQVYRLNLSTGALTSILTTGSDYSGPIMFDAAGNLYYGATNFGTPSTGDLYKFSAAQVDNAFATNTPLTLASGTDLYNLDGSQYLALGDSGQFYQSNSPFGSAGTVSLLTASGGPLAAVGATSSSDFVSGLPYSGSTLYVAVTNSGSYATTVYKVVPEPGAITLLLGASGLAFISRRRSLRVS